MLIHALLIYLVPVSISKVAECHNLNARHSYFACDRKVWKIILTNICNQETKDKLLWSGYITTRSQVPTFLDLRCMSSLTSMDLQPERFLYLPTWKEMKWWGMLFITLFFFFSLLLQNVSCCSFITSIPLSWYAKQRWVEKPLWAWLLFQIDNFSSRSGLALTEVLLL